MQYIVNIILVAFDGSQEVAVASEFHAENLVRILDPTVVEEVVLYRMHVVEEGDDPHEFIRNMPLRNTN